MAKETTTVFGLRTGEEFQIDATIVTLLSVKCGEVYIEVKPAPPEVKKLPRRKRR